VGEYASPVWGKSSHTKKIDVGLYKSCRLLTKYLKNASVEKLYVILGINPPLPIRIYTHIDLKKTKLTSNPH